MLLFLVVIRYPSPKYREPEEKEELGPRPSYVDFHLPDFPVDDSRFRPVRTRARISPLLLDVMFCRAPPCVPFTPLNPRPSCVAQEFTGGPEFVWPEELPDLS